MGYGGPVNSFTIYQTGGDTAAVFADLRRQIETLTGEAMRPMDGGYHRVRIEGPVAGAAGFNLDLHQKAGRVVLEINKLH